MNRNGWLAVLALVACGPVDRADWRPSGPTRDGTVPICQLPGDTAGACRHASILGTDEGRPKILDSIDAPPFGWHPPSVPIPFGFVEPTRCVESPPIRDLGEACRIDTYSPEGFVTEREVRLGDRVTRYQDGVLVEEVVFDGAGRVIRRTANGQTETWAYREDGALLDRRWARPPEQIEREVRSCEGRIDQLVTSECGAPPRQYLYDSEGRLARIEQSSDQWDVGEDFVYDSSGRLRAQSRGWNSRNFWDAAGRLIRSDHSASSDGTEQHQYGAEGLVRTYYVADGLAHYSGLTEYRYDEGRLTLWWRVFDANLGKTFRNATLTEAHRLTYSCRGGQAIEEIDHDAEGTADVIIQWIPQGDGSVHETWWTPTQGARLKKVHHFDCE